MNHVRRDGKSSTKLSSCSSSGGGETDGTPSSDGEKRHYFGEWQ